MNGLLGHTSFDTLTGRLVRHLRRRRNSQCVNIVTYHSISSRPSVFTDGTTLRHHPAAFEGHLDYLAAHHRPMSLRSVVEALDRGESLERALVITLDDGYADALRCALPILHRRRIPMTVFPVAGVIGNGDLLWQHKLAWLIDAGHARRVQAALTEAGVTALDSEASLSEAVRRRYAACVPDVLEAVLRDVGQSGAALARRLRPYIELDEMTSVDCDLVEFGSHTMTHPVLAALTPEQQREEIVGGRGALRDITGTDPLAFAYPFGLRPHYDADSTRLAREAGHRAIVDMRRRVNAGSMDPYRLSRKPASHGPQSEFERVVEDWPDNDARMMLGETD